MTLPRIGITMGDPAGIGPEVCLQGLVEPDVLDVCTPILFGDLKVLRRVAEHCSLPLPERVINHSEWATAAAAIEEPAIVDLNEIDVEEFQPGVVSAKTGKASYRYIEAGIEAALAGQIEAVTTGPVHKEALNAAGILYPGHTEIFAAKTNTDRYCMMLTSRDITCSFVTTHVGYRDVPGLLSVEAITNVIQLSRNAMRDLHGREPKLVVCALNPHAGENGLFGDREEERFIIPAIEAARAQGANIEGPLPPDTAFLREHRAETDCFVCMYHDQGHIPLKALAFDIAVNVTLGLPIIRTSVDHGTALDIAWSGKADVSSLVQASVLAARLANQCPSVSAAAKLDARVSSGGRS